MVIKDNNLALGCPCNETKLLNTYTYQLSRVASSCSIAVVYSNVLNVTTLCLQLRLFTRQKAEFFHALAELILVSTACYRNMSHQNGNSDVQILIKIEHDKITFLSHWTCASLNSPTIAVLFFCPLTVGSCKNVLYVICPYKFDPQQDIWTDQKPSTFSHFYMKKKTLEA